MRYGLSSVPSPPRNSAVFSIADKVPIGSASIHIHVAKKNASPFLMRFICIVSPYKMAKAILRNIIKFSSGFLFFWQENFQKFV